MTLAYIALGSNLGEPYLQLERALTSLALLPDTRLLRVSSVYRSAAVGPGMQPDYLNAVLLLTTNLPAIDLLDAMHRIESAQGRVRDIHWGARTLDLDLLLYADMIITSPHLTLPHPRMHLRNFVLYPMREISDVNLVMPDGSDLDTLLRQCPDHGLVRTEYRLQLNQDTQSK